MARRRGARRARARGEAARVHPCGAVSAATSRRKRAPCGRDRRAAYRCAARSHARNGDRPGSSSPPGRARPGPRPTAGGVSSASSSSCVRASIASEMRSRWIATSQAVARLARRTRPVHDASERIHRGLVAPQADLVQRVRVRGDRAHQSEAVAGGKRPRLAPGGREARRVAAHGGNAGDVGEASREDRRLPCLACQARALVGGGSSAGEAARVVVAGCSQDEQERQAPDHRALRARRPPPWPAAAPSGCSSPSSPAAATAYSSSSGSSIRCAASMTSRSSSRPPTATPAAVCPEADDGAPDHAAGGVARLGEAARKLPRGHQPPGIL